MAKIIKVGKCSFLASALVGVELNKAQGMFGHIDKRIVETAWNEANKKAPEKAADDKPKAAKPKPAEAEEK